MGTVGVGINSYRIPEAAGQRVPSRGLGQTQRPREQAAAVVHVSLDGVFIYIVP